MYNVGFGDCFLIFLPKGKTVLVDGGFHSQGKGAFSGTDLATQVIADVKAATGSERIDIVIATHRHQDHVFAFNAKNWESVDIGEVWLPWVEDLSTTEARNLWKKQRRFAAQLAAAAPSFQISAEDRTALNFLLWNAGIGGGDGAFAAWSNDAALETLRTGFRRRDVIAPRFLPATTQYPETFTTDILPGVRVSVLGPPRDAELFAKIDPERDGESYRALMLRAAEVALPQGGALESPFGDAWVATKDPKVVGPLTADEISRLEDLARNLDPLFAAKSLDDMINSTSLVLVLDIGSARLLFAGDAEWGTWKRILDDANARSLLRGITFFKVGHHGSHNATPKTLVEEVLPSGIPAMVSTQKGDGSYRNDIPLKELFDAFDVHKILAVRSDEPPTQLPANFTRGPGGTWVDLRLPC